MKDTEARRDIRRVESKGDKARGDLVVGLGEEIERLRGRVSSAVKRIEELEYAWKSQFVHRAYWEVKKEED